MRLKRYWTRRTILEHFVKERYSIDWIAWWAYSPSEVALCDRESWLASTEGRQARHAVEAILRAALREQRR